MAPNELHRALETLRPKDFNDDVPLDDLSNFLSSVFEDATVIANSVPLPPGGDDFASVSPKSSSPNVATKAAEMIVSPARPPPKPASVEKLAQGWGKPLKMNARDNPLGIAVFKMAAHDRHGAWFARSSVHEGLGFAKWKAAMKKEFDESLAVQGGPGEGNIRGIGGDRRLERETVEGVGKLEGQWSTPPPCKGQLLTTSSVSIISAIPRSNCSSRIYYTSLDHRRQSRIPHGRFFA
jgi:hypothetical protein